MNSLPPVNKSELESKHLSELHVLAAEAGVERYRMLPRAELIEKLAGGETGGETKKSRGSGREPRQRGGREERQRKEGGGEKPRGGGRQRRPRREESSEGGRARKERSGREPERAPREKEPAAESPPSEPPATADPAAAARPKRKRRRRRWGRRPKGVRVHDLLLPAAPGRQAVVYSETREGCTALLRGVAAELADAADGADPIALLIDPTPEELAEWRREAPKAEIVAAGQARHAEDAIAQATLRANGGENVVVLIDSLSRFAESYGDADGAKDLFDAGRKATGNGTLTVVAAVERPS